MGVYICPVCEGRGFVSDGFYDGAPNNTAPLTYSCRSCDSKGIVFDPAGNQETFVKRCGCASDINGSNVVVNDETIRHAKWYINPDGYYPQCTNCLKEPKSRELTHYCPHCGAKMDGRGE